MTIVPARPFLAAVVLAALAAAGGCQRESGGDSKSSGDAAPSPAAQTPAATPATAETEAATPQVLRWDCDGGLALTTKYLPRDGAISLGLHEGERKLPRVAAASGEKYQDGPITFWSKGGTATYERTPAPLVNCRRAAG